MAGRNVKRSGDRQALVRHYYERRWYSLPDWARVWVADNVKWVAVACTVLLLPSAILGVFLSYQAFPLAGYLGFPTVATANDVGLAALALVAKFICLVLSLRPLFRRQVRGWYWLIVAAAIHFMHSLILQHAITGGFLLLLTLYLYFQVRGSYKR